jgi:glutathione S-transferase
MVTLFHSPDSRSSRFIWLLEELGVDYELVYCDIPRRSGRGAPDPRNPHPDKRVPALSHDGQVVTEQAAIALYLTDAFPAAGLGVPANAPERGAYLTWLAFYAGEVDASYATRALYGDRLDPMNVRDYARVVGRVRAALARGPYLLGERFTAADILVSGPFEWDAAAAPVDDTIRDWLQRLTARPAAQRATARDSLS